MAYACLQVWTFKNRVAFVLSVTDKGQPVRDGIKLQRLKQLLRTMMDKHGNGVVNIKTVHDFLLVPASVLASVPASVNCSLQLCMGHLS